MGKYGPLWEHDRHAMVGQAALTGVDEAGRGPLAGPVVAAAVCIEPAFFQIMWEPFTVSEFDDSKKIPEATRLELFAWLEKTASNGHLRFRSAEATVEEIGEHNILHATALAMDRAISALPELYHPDLQGALPLFENLGKPSSLVLVDGKPMKRLPHPHKALVKGDGTSLVIAMASIVAKTLRDRIMVALDEEYPAYGFAKHKGYGTKQHLDAILLHGPCPVHRPKFLEKILAR